MACQRDPNGNKPEASFESWNAKPEESLRSLEQGAVGQVTKIGVTVMNKEENASLLSTDVLQWLIGSIYGN